LSVSAYTARMAPRHGCVEQDAGDTDIDQRALYAVIEQ
jgi:hypothetical protein